MVTKKEEIISLLKDFTIDEIVEKGYSRKYVNEVIRQSKAVNNKSAAKDYLPQSISNDFNNISCERNTTNKKNEIRNLIETLNYLMDNSNVLENLEIKMSVDIRLTTNNQLKILTSDIKSNYEEISAELPNPIDIFRMKGKDFLIELLNQYDVVTLKEISKKYTPDVRGYLLKWQDKSKIVDYIVERSESLSEKGSVFTSD